MYKLYVGRLAPIPDGVRYSYYDSRRKHLFLLTDAAVGDGFREVPDELLPSLDAGERTWYNEACRALNREWIEAHPKEAETVANEFLDLLEEELRAEMEKLKGRRIDGGEKENDGAEDESGSGDH